MARGRFITLEGGEGTGKSTQVRLLCARLQGAGVEALATREPGGSPGAEAIRKLLVSGAVDRWEPITEALLHFAARRDHVLNVIEPALARGAWVVSDRFADSTIAYQGYGQGADLQSLEQMYALAVGDLAPDLTLMLDLPVEAGLARAAARPDRGSRYERMDRAMHERLRAGFLEIAKQDPSRCIVIDAAPSEDAVHDTVWRAVRERLKPGSDG